MTSKKTWARGLRRRRCAAREARQRHPIDDEAEDRARDDHPFHAIAAVGCFALETPPHTFDLAQERFFVEHLQRRGGSFDDPIVSLPHQSRDEDIVAHGVFAAELITNGVGATAFEQIIQGESTATIDLFDLRQAKRRGDAPFDEPSRARPQLVAAFIKDVFGDRATGG